jgi:excinuclease ABC subunit A
MRDNVSIKGAREHNLKNIDLELPRNKLIVITGLSGSGKSTLAFDTIYAEGQRRYVESLSAYARQFLGLMDKPDVDSIEALSPAISIEQKSTSKNPRSTVGTVTEIYDYLRLLFARIGVHHCPKCGSSIHPQSAENITSLIMAEKNRSLVFLAPIIRGMKGTHEQIFDDLKKEGYTKIRVDQKIYETDHIKDEVKLVRYEKHWIEAVIDTVTICDEERSRIAEAVESALKTGKGTMVVIDASNSDAGEKKELQRFEGETMHSTFGACPNHPEIVFESLNHACLASTHPLAHAQFATV